MDKLIILFFAILWMILQARRKAIREQAQRQAKQGRASQAPARRSPPIRQRSSLPAALGAVSAEENQARPPWEMPMEQWDDRAKTTFAANETPKEIQALMESRGMALPPLQDEERVEEIVSPVSEMPYKGDVATRARISFAPDAIRTFIVTREILGPARFRNPHRPGNRSR